MEALFFSLVGFIVCLHIGQADAAYNISTRPTIRCFQCNVYSKGRPFKCIESDGQSKTIRHNCFACMKSLAVTSMHDRREDSGRLTQQFRKRGSSYSKYCITDERFERPEGCESTYSINGYTKRCFCKTDLCNGATVESHIGVPVYILVAAFTLNIRHF